MNIGDIVSTMLSSLLSFFYGIVGFALLLAATAVAGFFLFFFCRYRFHPLHLDAARLREPYIRQKPLDLFRWLLVDFLEREKHRGEFSEYGFTFYVGRQGAGKTISMVRYLELIKERYPHCLIVTNFHYYQADWVMTDWQFLLALA